MQNKDNQQQSTEANAMLTDADLDIINGGNWLGDAFRAIGGFIPAPSTARATCAVRSTVRNTVR